MCFLNMKNLSISSTIGLDVGGATPQRLHQLIVLDCGISLHGAALHQVGLDRELLIWRQGHVCFERLISNQADLDMVLAGGYEHCAAYALKLIRRSGELAVDKDGGAL